jgi:hypothetical protein
MLFRIKQPANPHSCYVEIRTAGMAVISKLLKSPEGKRFDVIKAARKLTLPMAGNTLIFDGETEMYAHADFFLFDYRMGGETIVGSCTAQSLGLSPLEAEFLIGLQQGRTSLFEVLESNPGKYQVRLQDLLEPERPSFCLTDRALSASMAAFGIPMLLFFRLLTVRGINMTSGVSFVFLPEHKERLLRDYRERMKTVAAADRAERRFVFFFQKHLQCGEDQAYQDVRPSAATESAAED